MAGFGSNTPSMPTFSFSSGDSGGGGGGFNPLRKSLGLVGNLAKDVGQAALGLPAGIAELVNHPIRSAENIVDVYKYTYGPLFQGDFDEFGDRVYEHPLGPILDLATLFTMGAAGAAKAGAVTAKAGGTGKLARLNQYAKSEPRILFDNPASPSRAKPFTTGASVNVPRTPILRYTQSNPAAKFRQQKYDQFKNYLSSRGGVFGIDPAQVGYERAYLADFSGAAGATEVFFAKVARSLGDMKKAEAEPFFRANMIKQLAYHNHEQAAHHAIAANRVAPLREVLQGNYNMQAFGPQLKKGSLTKKGQGGSWWADPSDKNIMDSFTNMGSRMMYTGSNPKKNAHRFHTYKDPKTGETMVPLLNKQTAENLGIEMGNTSNAVLNMYYKGTAMWKAAVLGLVPRFFVNNAVGNGFMYLMDNAGDGALFGMYQSMKYMKGEHKAGQELGEMLDSAGAFKSGNFVERYFGDQVAQAFHSSALPTKASEKRAVHQVVDEGLMDAPTPTMRARGEAVVNENKLTRAGQPLLKFAAKYAERNLRVATIYLRTRKLPQHKAEMARLEKMFPKWSYEKRFNQAAINVFNKEPTLHRKIAQEVEQSMGNYNMLSGAERKLRTVDPFYTWQRHIFKNSFHMGMNRPGRTNVGTKIGQMGYDKIQGMFGEAPDFIGGMVPFGGEMLPGDDNRQFMFNAAGMNPYAAFGEEAKLLESLLPGGAGPQIGETIGTQLNPFIQAAGEGLFQSKLLTGQPQGKKTYGPVDAFLKSLHPFDIPAVPFANLPHVRMSERALFPADYQGPTLYEKSPIEDLSSFFGIPMRNVAPSEVPPLARSQRTRRGED
jgi:hypothetical protein